MQKKTVVVALGGNAITREFEEGTITEQFSNTRKSLRCIIELIRLNYRVVICHGNGPQVGHALIRVEETRQKIPPLPLGVIVADLEGGMGYMIEQCLQNKMNERGLHRSITTILTQVIVSKDDPSIKDPTKFIGPFYTKEMARQLEIDRGWIIREDPGRGYRRVVPSPVPIEILPRAIIKLLLDNDIIVIAAGGGGIPVYREPSGWLEGVDGVIDKDLASAVLAKDVSAKQLIILTGVDKVALNFRRDNQIFLDRMTVSEAKQYMAEGQFPAGSMGTKVQAAINFLEWGGEKVIITSTAQALQALYQKNGTHITYN